jgi:formate/nitrite transporter
MTYVRPDLIVQQMVEAGARKAALPARQLVLRGFLGGALLAFATTLAFQVALETTPIVGALLFPVGFVMIVLLGMELVTGNFALIPLAVKERKATAGSMLANWAWVSVGHLLGCAVYACLYGIAVTAMGSNMDAAMAQRLIQAAEAKTIAYEALGASGWGIVFVKAILCNWMVTMGVVMGMTSSSTSGKIVAMWLPILTFFAQGFEHAVVNMFVIPAGMMLGADVSAADWWLWNQIPVLLGNVLGGFLFTGMAIYAAHRSKGEAPAARPQGTAAVLPAAGQAVEAK